MPTGSLAPLFIEMTLFSGGTAVPLRSDQFFQSLEIEEVSGGSWIGTLVLFDREGDFLESLVIAAGLDRYLKLRFGRGDAFPTEPLEYEGGIVTYEPTFEPHGITLTIELVARPVLPSMADKKIRSFESGLLVSEMVEQIADDRGWEAFIEPTNEGVAEPFSSTGESDLQFISEQLRPQAVNAAGEGGYVFFFDEKNQMHFRTPDYLSPEVHAFTYARAIAGDVISFAPADVSLFGKLMGGGNTSFGGAGSLLGSSTQRTSSVVGGVGSGGSPVQSDSGAKADYGTGTHAYVDLATRDPAELARLAQARFDEFRRYEYQGVLQVHGTHRVRMTDYVQIDYVKSDGRLHYLSGRFQVFRRKHTVDTSEWVTEYEVLRSGIANVEGTVSVSSTQVNSPPASSGSTGFELEVET